MVCVHTLPSRGRGEPRLVAKPFSVVKLMLTDISRIAVRNTNADHYLLVRFARKQTSHLELWLRPKVLLFWGHEAPIDDGIGLGAV